MITKPEVVMIAAAAAVGVTSPAPAKYIRNLGALLLMTSRGLYYAHMQTGQMRLASTRRLGTRDHRLSLRD